MANEPTNMTDRERLAEVSLEGCYLETLLGVIERVFEEIDTICDNVPPHISGLIRREARKGLNITYMAEDKAAAVKRVTDDIERELWAAERNYRSANLEMAQ